MASRRPHRHSRGLLAKVERVLAAVPNVWQCAVWLGVTLEKARHGTHLSGAYFEVADGGVLLRVEIDDLRWMAASLAGLGVPLVIYHPPNCVPPCTSTRSPLHTRPNGSPPERWAHRVAVHGRVARDCRSPCCTNGQNSPYRDTYGVARDYPRRCGYALPVRTVRLSTPISSC